MASWPGSCTAISKSSRAHRGSSSASNTPSISRIGCVGAGLAQGQRLLDAGDAQHVGLGQRRQHAGGAVAVGVGLDDGRDLGAAAAAAGLAQIVAQGGEVDGGRGGAHQA